MTERCSGALHASYGEQPLHLGLYRWGHLMAQARTRRKGRRKETKTLRRPTTRAIDLDFSGAPKKKRPSGLPPRTTAHKKSAAWFQARVAWPYRERSSQSLLSQRAATAATLAPQTGATDWELVGPVNVGGRMTCVACAPKKPNTIWAGAAGGGVWKS